MRIVGLEVHALALPVRDGGLARRTLLVVRSDLGLGGVGEAPGTFEPELGAAIEAAVAGADPLEWALLRDRLGRVPPAAAAAVETACLDLRGKATGRAVHDLLGGKLRSAIPAPALPPAALPSAPPADPLLAAVLAAGSGAQRVVWLDFWALGGFEPCRAAAEILGRQGASVGLSGGIETGVGLAARLHLGASHPAFTAGLASSHGALVRDVLRFPLAADPDGGYRVPAGPGLGVEPDADALREFRLEAPEG